MELCIGTTEVGTQYGARPNAGQIEEMLACALEHGITGVDTASAYGEVEKLVGQYLKGVDRKSFSVVTKLRPGVLYSIAPQNYYKTLRQNLEESMRSLHVDYVDGCLFHNGEYAHDIQAIAALAKLKKDGLARKIGFVTYLPAEFERVMKLKYVDIVQIPYNVLDTRLDGLLKKARPELEIQARGVFLQGLLLMDEQDVPQELWDAKQYLLRIDSFCEYYGLSRMQTVLNFPKTQPRIGKTVFEAVSLSQLKDVQAAFHTEVDKTALLELAEEFSMVEEKILMPNLWHIEYK